MPSIKSNISAYLALPTVPNCNMIEFWISYPEAFQQLVGKVLAVAPDTNTVVLYLFYLRCAAQQKTQSIECLKFGKLLLKKL